MKATRITRITMSKCYEDATDCQIEADKTRAHPCHLGAHGCSGWETRTCDACGREYCKLSPMRPSQHSGSAGMIATCGPCRVSGALSVWQEKCMNGNMGPKKRPLPLRPFRISLKRTLYCDYCDYPLQAQSNTCIRCGASGLW